MQRSDNRTRVLLRNCTFAPLPLLGVSKWIYQILRKLVHFPATSRACVIFEYWSMRPHRIITYRWWVGREWLTQVSERRRVSLNTYEMQKLSTVIPRVSNGLQVTLWGLWGWSLTRPRGILEYDTPHQISQSIFDENLRGACLQGKRNMFYKKNTRLKQNTCRAYAVLTCARET